MDSYQHLVNLSKAIKTLEGASQVLSWDQETHMPKDAGPVRGEQLEAMAGIIHREKTSEKFSQALEQLIDLKTGTIKISGLGFAKEAALREWHRDYKHNISLPSAFVEEFAKTTSQAQLVWRVAKEKEAFHHFAPFLEKIVDLCRQKAEFLGYQDHPYDALLNLYEPSITTKDLDSLFSQLKASLVSLLKKIALKPQVDCSFLEGNFSEKKQQTLSKKLLKAMGYDLRRGTVDFSAHPFCIGIHPRDCRITTRIDRKNFLSNLLILLHEGGHSLYEMGLPEEEYGTPLGETISLGMHESQSRWWETRIGHSKAFWSYFLPQVQKTFRSSPLDQLSLNTFYQGINKVTPSFIRVEADEVTYSLHVILRYELEKALIEGSLSIRDIPEAWNGKMQELLGLTPSNYSEGCLQDVHWSIGAFGYFPSYTLGNLYASHFFEAFEAANPHWEEQISKGEFSFMRDWLRENIHRHGRCYTSLELLKKVNGKTFTSEAFCHYLEKKFLSIYLG